MGIKHMLDSLSGIAYVSDVQDWDDVLVGRSIVSASTEEGLLVLDDGAVLKFDKENSDCCSWVELSVLRATNNIITKVEVKDNEDETGGEGAYKAWMTVLTEAGPINVAEMEGNASNGYYLHGFALGVSYVPPSEQ
jgi:hypothetical protein